MNGFAIAGLIYLYVIVYGFGLWAALKARNKPDIVINKSALKVAFFVQFLELLAILAIWLDHDPMSLPRAFVAITLMAEVVFEAFRGYLHYKNGVPMRRNPVKAVVQSAVMVVLITLLAFVL